MAIFHKDDPPKPTQLPAEPAGKLVKPKADNALPEPPILDGYGDRGEGLQVVTLIGLLEEPTAFRVGKPIPQDVRMADAIFNLSDRAAGVYTFRHK